MCGERTISCLQRDTFFFNTMKAMNVDTKSGTWQDVQMPKMDE